MYTGFIKRILDFTGALTLLILLSPLMAVIGLILFLYNRGAVFFIQRRPGKNEKPFMLCKFQTMVPETERNLPDTERITWLGNILRKTSLDELPQLFNVLKGEMSFVGPRPLLMEYLPLYSEAQKKRHLVLPGITGWAQVNGRNAISWEDKFIKDLYYVEYISFWLDTKILFLTVLRIFSGKGVDVVEKFKGV